MPAGLTVLLALEPWGVYYYAFTTLSSIGPSIITQSLEFIKVAIFAAPAVVCEPDSRGLPVLLGNKALPVAWVPV